MQLTSSNTFDFNTRVPAKVNPHNLSWDSSLLNESVSIHGYVVCKSWMQNPHRTWFTQNNCTRDTKFTRIVNKTKLSHWLMAWIHKVSLSAIVEAFCRLRLHVFVHAFLRHLVRRSPWLHISLFVLYSVCIVVITSYNTFSSTSSFDV